MFSPQELKLIHVLGKKKMRISEIAEQMYDDEKLPVDPGNAVAAMIRRITHKCKYHKLDWTLNGKGLGREGKTVWKEKRI